MEGKAPVPYQPLGLLLPDKIPNAIAVVGTDVAVLDGVEKIIVKISRPSALQADGKLILGVLGVLCHTDIQFGGQGKALTGVSADQGLSRQQLRVAVVIHIGGVEIGHTCLQKTVHHSLALCKIVFSVFQPGQTHESKAQLWSSHRFVKVHMM